MDVPTFEKGKEVIRAYNTCGNAADAALDVRLPRLYVVKLVSWFWDEQERRRAKDEKISTNRKIGQPSLRLWLDFLYDTGVAIEDAALSTGLHVTEIIRMTRGRMAWTAKVRPKLARHIEIECLERTEKDPSETDIAFEKEALKSGWSKARREPQAAPVQVKSVNFNLPNRREN